MGLWAYKSCKEKWKHHITLYFIWYPFFSFQEQNATWNNKQAKNAQGCGLASVYQAHTTWPHMHICTHMNTQKYKDNII